MGQGWIKFPDDSPTEVGLYLVYHPALGYNFGYWNEDDEIFDFAEGKAGWTNCDVDYFHELPDAPKV